MSLAETETETDWGPKDRSSVISKMGNTLGVRKKRGPKDGPKPRNHVLLPTKSVKNSGF